MNDLLQAKLRQGVKTLPAQSQLRPDRQERGLFMRKWAARLALRLCFIFSTFLRAQRISVGPHIWKGTMTAIHAAAPLNVKHESKYFFSFLCFSCCITVKYLDYPANSLFTPVCTLFFPSEHGWPPEVPVPKATWGCFLHLWYVEFLISR